VAFSRSVDSIKELFKFLEAGMSVCPEPIRRTIRGASTSNETTNWRRPAKGFEDSSKVVYVIPLGSFLLPFDVMLLILGHS
jgi:hypothetical protein